MLYISNGRRGNLEWSDLISAIPMTLYMHAVKSKKGESGGLKIGFRILKSEVRGLKAIHRIDHLIEAHLMKIPGISGVKGFHPMME